MILTMMTTMNIMFMFMKHPMSMGLILIMQTLMVSMQSGVLMKSFWLSYIMTITILSGMLVLFIYMASIASNEKFKNNKTLWAMALMTTGSTYSVMMYFSPAIWMKVNTPLNFAMTKNTEIMFLQKMLSNENMYITIIMMMYLFYTMIVVNYIVNIHEGPMKFNS